MSVLNPGEVAVTISGVDYTLKPSLRALDQISGHFGGLSKARDAIVVQDFSSVVVLLRLALNLTATQAATMRESVYTNGLTVDLLVPLLNFVGILSNGGRPMPDAPVDEAPAGNG